MYLNTPKLKIQVRSPSIDVPSLANIRSLLRMENNITLCGEGGFDRWFSFCYGARGLDLENERIWFQVFIPRYPVLKLASFLPTTVSPSSPPSSR